MKSIRRKMMLTLVVGSVVLFGILLYISNVFLDPLPRLTKSQYAEIVGARSDEVSRKLEGMMDTIQVVSQSPIIRSMDLEAIKNYLPKLVLEPYRNMTIAYPDGTGWSTLDQKIDISNQQQYRDIFISKKKTAISQPFVSDFVYEPDNPIITISHEVLGDRGEIVGLVNVVVDLDFLSQVLAELDLASGGYAWIMDDEGLVVAHQDASVPYHKHISSIISNTGNVNQIFASNSGSVEYTKLDGQKMLAFYHKIDHAPGWTFLVSIDESSIYAGVTGVKQAVTTGLLVSLGIIIFFSYFITNRLTQPIVEFTKLFDQAASGNLNVRANENYKTEVGVAAQTFNTMLERIKILTYQDVTTYLYNYNGFLLELPQKVKHIMNQHRTIAIAIVSIDDFKRINSVNGYQMGDEVLRQFSKRLLQFLNGQGLAARFLGDEFILLIHGLHKQEVERKVQQLWDVCRGEIVIGENSFILQTSIGASVMSHYDMPVDTVIHEATVAKLSAKKDGGNQYRFYNIELDRKIKLEQKIDLSLYYALTNNELYLVYQPIVDVETNRIIGVETLLRWNHPEFKTISIQKVIEQAEQSGMIVEIGRWILKEACIQAKVWQDAGYEDLVIAVNVSAIQFEQESFIEMVQQILDETGIRPHTLELEITENIAMDNVYGKLSKLSTLQEMGVRIALDDFGTGYSSLAYFTRFPIDTLKIDRSFIVGLFQDEHAKSITTTIINLAKSTHISTVAEGVETKEQLEYLKSLNCDKIQGYYFSKPTSPEVIMDMLINQERLGHFALGNE